MTTARRATFITWYPYCRRSDTIAEALGGTSHLVHYLSFKKPLHAPFKYLMQAVTTLRTLRRERPDVVLVAVPPIFAALPVWYWARRHGARFVIDAHTGIFEHARWTWLLPLSKLILRSADAVIVTNEHLRQRVTEWGARGVVIGDVPVKFVTGRAPAPCIGPRVVVVNTFSVDEPVDAVLAAARQLADVQFFVTGDVRAAQPAWIREKPANLAFTGFVSEDDYAGLMRAADVVLVLTTHDHTMQRGGYEAVALGKPLVTSDWELLRETFSRGTIHVRNEPAAIADGVRRAIADRDKLGSEMETLGTERRALFARRLATLVEILDGATVMERPVRVTA